MKSLFLSLILVELLTLSISIDLNTFYKEYIKAKGYDFEEYPVTTSDGYILPIWHLNPKSPNGKVVFLQHGLFDTAWCFFQLGDNSIPFLLLKEGFDIWLGNVRGNVFTSHVTKDKNKLNGDFYDYTIDDFVQIDLPTMINFIKSKIGNKKISYIGHSQGTTMFVMLNMHNPSYAQKNFDKFIALATVPNIAYTHFAPIEILDKIAGILKAVNIFNTFNLSNTQRKLVSDFCKTFPGICGKFFDMGASITPTGRTDYTNIYNFMYYYPGGGGKPNLLQWSQIHKEKKLVYYNPNYDKEKTATPYDINNLKKWKINALITRTDDDTFSSYQDVTEFYNTVEKKSLIQILDLKNYGHLDVLASDSALEDIFYPIINFLKN
jgi:pimeloyl-ACP methyl ester carboxylesterase